MIKPLCGIIGAFLAVAFALSGHTVIAIGLMVACATLVTGNDLE